MRKIVANYNGKYAGTDSSAGFIFPEGTTDDQAQNDLIDWAYQEHEQWEGLDDDNDEIEDEGPDWSVEDYDPDKHGEDMHFEDLRPC